MLDFDYFRRNPDAYRPRTANSAMRAVEAELLPEEACVYLGTSVKPLNEEPIDLDDIEQILSRTNLDLDTILLLIQILSGLLQNPDAEVALFAAESINRIESRYNQKIEALKERLGKKTSATPLRTLARQYYELAQMHPGSIRNFYLREAFDSIKKLNKLKRLNKEDVILLTRILLALELTGQANRIMTQLADQKDLSYLLLQAEVAFKKKDISSVQGICDRLKAEYQNLDEEGRAFLSYWYEENL
jgi:hypothetical protein